MMLTAYQQQIATANLQFDEAQWQCLQQLDAISKALAAKQPCRGLYIYGPVGRGKTMLMDSFFDHLPTTRKIRLHFHHFMARVHQELHALTGAANPLQQVAKNWASNYQLLCFDEFFVNDIGDAMLLGTLWRELFALGVVLVTTSNSHPDDLYANGLQRSRFLPTISLLKQYCDLVALDNGIDYRRMAAADFCYYGQKVAGDWLKNLTARLTGSLQDCTSIEIQQRTIPALWCNQQAIGFDFMALCSGPRSQLDYMALADKFSVIAVANIPQFQQVSDTAILHGVEENYQREHSDVFVSKLDNEARRFIALVDECYDRGCLLLLTSEVPVNELYKASQLQFAFERCISRIYEMQSWQHVASN
jgi:cell division protein ZapE